MSEQEIICPRCKAVSLHGTEYCQQCGEVLDPKTKAEIQRLAIVLRDLDTRIAANKGNQTVYGLRSEYYVTYQNLRRAPWLRTAAGTPRPQHTPVPFATLQQEMADARAAAPAAPVAFKSEVISPPAAAPARPPAAASLTQKLLVPTPLADAMPTAAAPKAEAAPAPRRVTAPMPQTPVPPAPRGPVFSWQAFAAEQAIAIMVYLGGFLGLIATLTTVISRGEQAPQLTLAIVSLVYVVFAIAGFTLRRVARLRTVSRVYLAVFALMTPLVALAIYRYQLQQINFPVAAMLCLSAFYATIVYLALAVQTRFATYAYLGWVALIVGALAIIPWFHLDLQWWIFDLGLTTLALLGPHYTRHHEHLSILAEPATQVAVLATIPVIIGVQVLGYIGLYQTVVPTAFPSIYVQAAALALGACVQVPITAGWRIIVPAWRPAQQNVIVDFIDGFNAVFFAEAVGGVALWIITAPPNTPLEQVSRSMAVVLAATGLVEFGLALALSRWQPQRRALRIFLEILGMLLASSGAYLTMGDAPPNSPLLIALGAALVISVGAAMIDSEWWLLVSGFFLVALSYHLALLFIPADQVAPSEATLYFALSLALWAVAMAAGVSARSRRFVAPVYLVAFCTALYTLVFLAGHDGIYQTEILLTFSAAAFSAGLRERAPNFTVVTGLFGGLAVLALAFDDANGFHSSLLALGLTLAALAARRVWGWKWALAPYAIALWGVVVAAAKTSFFAGGFPNWNASGLPYTSWFLLFFAVIAFGVALWENAEATTVIAAGLALWAYALASLTPGVTDGIHLSLLTLAFTLAALLARRLWGREWAFALYGLALVTIIFTASQTAIGSVHAPDLTASGLPYTSWFLLFFAVIAFGVARWEGVPTLTMVPSLLALWAYVIAAPSPGADAIHIGLLTLAFALAALLARRLWGWAWAAGPYTIALLTIVLTAIQTSLGRLSAPDWSASGLSFTSWYLLLFAVIAFGVAIWENAPMVTVVAAMLAYWALRLVTDDIASVALVFVLIAAGMAARRWCGQAWGIALELAAGAGSVTVALQLNNLGSVAPNWQVVFLLAMAVAAYLVATQEREPILSVLAVIYALVAVYLLPGPDNLLTTLDFTFGFAGLGAIHRLPTLPRLFRREWSYAPYLAAIGCSILAVTRIVPFNATEAQALLLIFAAVAYMLVALEGAPQATILPALYAMASVFVNPDEHALLPLALGLAILGLIVGRAAGMRWAWALYAASAVAAAGTIYAAQNDSAFQALALLILAALTYVIAAIESRPDVLVAALTLGLLALGAWANTLHLPTWLGTLAFLALGWVYTLGASLWERIPWMHTASGIWWAQASDTPTANYWRSPRNVGAVIHRAGGLLVVTCTGVVGVLAPGSFDKYNPQTLTAGISLLALAGMLVTVAPRLWARVGPLLQQPWFRITLYLAGELAALACIWIARWVGVDNVPLYMLAPGSYMLLVGAFLPADRYVPYARRIGQFASLTGSLLLLMPSLYQTFTDQSLTGEVAFGTIVLVEALVIIALGVGTHTRMLILIGSAFIGIDTISGAALALQKGVSIGIIIGAIALILISLATWLSLRSRQQPGNS
jgi:hypothetical protein